MGDSCVHSRLSAKHDAFWPISQFPLEMQNSSGPWISEQIRHEQGRCAIFDLIQYLAPLVLRKRVGEPEAQGTLSFLLCTFDLHF